MFAPQDEIRVQLPAEMRGVVEKLRSSGFSLGTVSALELISWSGAPQRADVPPPARLLTVTLKGASALEAFVRDLELSLTPHRLAHIGEHEREPAAGGFFPRGLFRSVALAAPRLSWRSTAQA